MDFEQLFSMAVIRDYLKERKLKEFMGELLFPETKIEDIDLAYIKGANNAAVSASIHGFDTETEIASREKLEYVKEQLALIKKKIKMGEELIIKLNTPRTSAEFEKAKELVFDDVDKMVLAVKTRIEAMRMEALTTGKIVANENGASVSLDYGVPSNNIKTLGGTSVWTDAASDPIKDIFDWTNSLLNTAGITPTRALTSNAVLSTLLTHDKVKKDIFGLNTKALNKKELNDFLQMQGLPIIATYDERYRVQNANGTYTTKRFFDENKFVMMPEYALGETIYGLTPEEIELSGKAGNEVSEREKVVVQIYSTKDPVARWTKAVATALPTFPFANEVIIAKVK
ncbi:phage major capsid protein E [Peptoanaerobacter stomatis]|uniref:Phage major capsid protein E n=1 Tax=Peptoanaerobacter stomatis TaxID=796937 RepID=J6HD00_9FIRM|nr:major capsid protein [Peptoanaerobacter stomatis]EJU22975.1 phage major capsid protein E [Peptoanaerobacter stomatis]